MKRKQAMAVLLSAVLSLSACVPLTGVSAWAAGDETTEDTGGVLITP